MDAGITKAGSSRSIAIPGNEQAIARLRMILSSGRALGFAGAGTSAGLYPLWGTLLDSLAREAVARGLASAEDVLFWEKERTHRPQRVAGAIRKKLSEGSYQEILRETFSRRRGADGLTFTPVHDALVRMPFQGLITTNYDPGLIEARLARRPDLGATGWCTWRDDPEVHRWATGEAFAPDALPILHAHGHCERFDTILLDHDDYHNAYRRGPYRRLFEQLWTTRNLVFVGYSFSDQWLEFLAENVLRSIAHVRGPPHIAIIGLHEKEAYSAERRRMFAEVYQAEVIFYPISKRLDGRDDHSALLDVLGPVALPPPGRGREPPRSPPIPLRLQDWAHDTTEDAFYVGREDVLARLHKWAGDPGVRVIAITGLGGIGKTSLVAHWLREREGMAQRPYDGLIFWSLYSQRDVRKLLARIVDFASERLGSAPAIGEDQLLANAKAVLAQHPMCIVLDGLEVRQLGADGAEHGGLLDPELRHLIEQAAHADAPPSLLILTSRFPFPDLLRHLGGPARQIHLDRLSPEESVRLLRRLRLPAPPEILTRMAERWEGHPLALRVLVAAMEDRSEGEVDQLKLIAAEGDLHEKIPKLLRFYEDKLPPARRSVMQVLSLFSAAAPEATILHLASSLHSAGGSVKAEEFSVELKTLVRQRLVVRVEVDGRDGYSCHPILRDHFRGRFVSDRPEEARGAADILAGAPGLRGPSSVREAQRILDAISLLHAANDHAAAYHLLEQRLGRGDLFLDVPAPHEGIECLSGFFDREHRPLVEGGVAALLANRLAACLQLTGELGLALEWDQRVRDHLAANDHDHRRISLLSSVQTLLALGRVKEALDHLDQARAIERIAPHDEFSFLLAEQTFVGRTQSEIEAEVAFHRGETRACRDALIRVLRATEGAVRAPSYSPQRTEVVGRHNAMMIAVDIGLRIGPIDVLQGLVDEHIRFLTRVGASILLPSALARQGVVLARRGEFDAAMHATDLARRPLKQTRLPTSEIQVALAHAEVLLLAGQHRGAVTEADVALSLARARRMIPANAQALILRGRARHATDPDGARDDAESALEIAEVRDLPWIELDALDLLATIDGGGAVSENAKKRQRAAVKLFPEEVDLASLRVA